jgi:membrane-bound serine protease (ClpP class)
MLEQLVESLVSNLRHSLFQIYSYFSLQVEPWVIVLIAITTATFITISIVLGIRVHHKPVLVGREDLVGRIAVVDTTLDPKGLVLVEGERWRAILDNGRAEPEDEVVIKKAGSLKLWVTKKETG